MSLRICTVYGHVMPSWSDLAWMSQHRRYQSRTLRFHMLPPMLYNPRVSLSSFTNANRYISRSKNVHPKTIFKQAQSSAIRIRRRVVVQAREDRYSLQMQSQPNIQVSKNHHQNPPNICDQNDLQRRRMERTSEPTRFPPWWDNVHGFKQGK